MPSTSGGTRDRARKMKVYGTFRIDVYWISIGVLLLLVTYFVESVTALQWL